MEGGDINNKTCNEKDADEEDKLSWRAGVVGRYSSKVIKSEFDRRAAGALQI